MGRRAVYDPFDAALIVERIAEGETMAADAWKVYAATAVHPCRRQRCGHGCGVGGERGWRQRADPPRSARRTIS
jgi:hypothetical protein